MTPLGRLIRTQRMLLGEPGPPRSLQEVADRATAAGYPLSKSGVADLEKRPLTNVPPTATLRGLSKGLSVAVEALVDAALESCGLARSQGQDPSWLLITDRASRMAEKERELVRRQVQAFLDFYESAGRPPGA